ncbi:hypothetical protein G6F51_013818 [Rhizopus arrhizus]|uniref:Uncharacterized protein n=1 Tax=Rhizopus oryzae TaxID=64495 RepID=A0A9P6XQL6_RHIOR|nr:hypothetical protein G6F51_013818 [Rhizopus arrhizus]
MPRLLKAAEEHSFSLGYRWNPAKCVMLNCAVSLGGPQFKLYGDPIPVQSTFNYLGVPFDDTGSIATGLLIQRNVTSAVSAMRRFLLPVGQGSSMVCASAPFCKSNWLYWIALKINVFV